MEQKESTSGTSLASLITLPLLLVLPALAVYRGFNPTVATYTGGWVTALSVLTFSVYYFDKRRAEKAGPRTPEALLHLFELLGGWPGAYLAQRWIRHKSAKVVYQVVFWFIIVIYELVALDWLLGWPIARAIGASLGPGKT